MIEKFICGLADKMEPFLKVAGAFDYITPIAGIMSNYQTLEFEGDYQAAIVFQQQLASQGVDCRIERAGWNGGRVVSKR